eukprot:c45952_g1_i1.p1 GENE.c45952_g1_i1~~c45952_g1_i1.p1  ORF type:complete len:537 (-),score=96.15 c45952_g1_i1:33-1643(-)
MRTWVLLLLVFSVECNTRPNKREAISDSSKSEVVADRGHHRHRHHHHHRQHDGLQKQPAEDVSLLQQSQSEVQPQTVEPVQENNGPSSAEPTDESNLGNQALLQPTDDLTSLIEEIESMKHEIHTLQQTNPPSEAVPVAQSASVITAPPRHKWAVGPVRTKTVETKSVKLESAPKLQPVAPAQPPIETIPAQKNEKAPEMATQDLVETGEGRVRVINLPSTSAPHATSSAQRHQSKGMMVKSIHFAPESKLFQHAETHRHAWGDGLEIAAELPQHKEIHNQVHETLVSSEDTPAQPVREHVRLSEFVSDKSVKAEPVKSVSPHVIVLDRTADKAPKHSQLDELVSSRSLQSLLSLSEGEEAATPTATDLSRMLIEKLDSNQAYDLLQKLIGAKKEPARNPEVAVQAVAPIPAPAVQSQSPPIIFNMDFGGMVPAQQQLLQPQHVVVSPTVQAEEKPPAVSTQHDEQSANAGTDTIQAQPAQKKQVAAEPPVEILLQVEEQATTKEVKPDIKDVAAVGPGRHLARVQPAQAGHRWRL